MSEIKAFPDSDQSVENARNFEKFAEFSRWPCLRCAQGEQIASYCCPRQAYISCSCSDEAVKIPLEHVEVLKRHAEIKSKKS